ncbi:MAG: hypothetical protein AAF149_09840 [Bacteroidota bacterium]
MNLWARKIGLLSLAALLLFSCEEENSIGLPPEDNLGIFFAEIPMRDYVKQVWVDDLPYDASGLLLVGEYEDPQLGEIKSIAFSDLSTTSLRASFPVSDTIDYNFVSADMTLRIQEAYGSTTNLPSVGYGVYQLLDTVDVNAEYTNSSALAIGNKIGETQFTFYLDSLGINLADSSDNQSITNIPDSLFDASGIYLYTASFDLDQPFWEDIFNQYRDVLLDTLSFPDSTLNASQEFDKIMKGIALQQESGNTALQFSGQDVRSFISVKYNRVTPSGTSEIEMFILFNSNKAFNEIRPNANSGWSLEKFNPLTDFYTPAELEDENAYIQSGANLFIALDFEPFKSFVDTLENTVFQGAELYLNSDSTLVLEGNDPISVLQFLLSSEERLNDNELVGIQDANFLGEVPIAINYDEADSNFIRIPTYLNQLTLDRTSLDKIIIRGPSVSRLDRIVIPKDSIFLRLYYSKTD